MRKIAFLTMAAIVSATCIESCATKNQAENHEYVDLGLSVKWATTNVGAATPASSGEYYAWGETETKELYVLGTYKWMSEADSLRNKYLFITSKDEFTNGNYNRVTEMDLADDVAAQKWGGKWRIPTRSEWDELADTNNCRWTWTDNYKGQQTHGYLVESKKKGFESKSIFLPAAGYYGDSTRRIIEPTYGYYWSRSTAPHTPGMLKDDTVTIATATYGINFRDDLISTAANYSFMGQSVRPVLAE